MKEDIKIIDEKIDRYNRTAELIADVVSAEICPAVFKEFIETAKELQLNLHMNDELPEICDGMDEDILIDAYTDFECALINLINGGL